MTEGSATVMIIVQDISISYDHIINRLRKTFCHLRWENEVKPNLVGPKWLMTISHLIFNISIHLNQDILKYGGSMMP